MKLSDRARSTLNRTGALLFAMVAVLGMGIGPAGAGTPLAEYEYGYEDGYQGWVPKTDQNTGTPECSPHSSAVVRTDAKAKAGVYSIDFQADGTHDCGLLWIEREFAVGTTNQVVVDLQLSLYSDDTGGGGPGGLNWVAAYVGPDCIDDPVQNSNGWDNFLEIADTNHDTPGWYGYNYRNNNVTPNAGGNICVAQAVKIASTYPFIKHYYLDETKVTIS